MQLYESSRLIFLWGVPLLILFLLWGERQRHKKLEAFGDPAFLEKRLMPGFSLSRRRAAAIFLMTCVIFSTLALARPQWGEEKRRLERKGIDVVFLLDTSLSMLAQDIKPDRLRKSKLEIKNLIRRFRGHRVGMVAFAATSFLQSPLTLDYSAFFLFVDALKPGFLPNPGTSLAQAIEMGLRAFSEENVKYRALIVFSDGEDHEGGMDEAILLAKKAGVRIYTIGVGTEQGEPIPLRAENSGTITGYKKDRNGQVVVTRLNRELLERVARETGAIYLPATPGEKEIDILLNDMATLGERKLKERLLTEREDHYQLFLLIALFFLVGESLWGEAGGRAVRGALPLLALFLLTGLIDTPKSLVEKGNRLTAEKKYKSAVESYRKAQVSRPREPVIRYNLGTTLYQLYDYRDAEKELEEALDLAKDPATQAKTLYNYGNTQYRLGNFDQAIDAYKKTLELNSKDQDAKYNLEFLKNKKSAFEQKQQEQKQKKQNQKQNQQLQQQQDQQQSQSENQQHQQQQHPQQQQNQNQQESKENQQGGQPQSKDQEKKQGQGQGENQEGQGQDQKPEGQQQNQPQEKGGSEDQKKGEQRKEKQQPEEQPGQEENQGQSQKPLQGQMSKENALRILDALMESEKELQDVRRPPVESGSSEPLKDW